MFKFSLIACTQNESQITVIKIEDQTTEKLNGASTTEQMIIGNSVGAVEQTDYLSTEMSH